MHLKCHLQNDNHFVSVPMSFNVLLQLYDAVTVLSSDIQGFCTILERSSPMQAMSMLNTMMLQFDALCDQNKCVKVCV